MQKPADRRPTFSVVMPAHCAGRYLPDTLEALRESRFPTSEWELIVVDDASDDDTGTIAARLADRVLRLPAPAGGPARARNAGAGVARGDWLVFFDADCRVHPETLRRFAEAIERTPAAGAVFGCYDAEPVEKGILTEYRNLLHRYVHLKGAGRARTFWAGCGAVRRIWFERVGGFDAERYPRPQIEDIELGFRLDAAGASLFLDPTIEVTHLKRWTLRSMIAMEIVDRGIPWTRLWLERRGRFLRSLNIGTNEPVKVGLTGIALAVALVGLAFATPMLFLALPGWALALTIWNRKLFGWFVHQRGIRFTMGIVPLQLAYYIGNVVSVTLGVLSFGWQELRRRIRDQDAENAARYQV